MPTSSPQAPPDPSSPSAACARRPTLADALAELTPANFGIVMATGIVSLACSKLGLHRLAWLLGGLNGALYLLMWGLLGGRLVRHRDRVRADLSDHGRSPGFFTVVAGTGVLGAQAVELAGLDGVGLALWWLALGLWVILTYTIFTILTVRDDKPALERGINGGWLLAVVATQSLAVLAALLAPGIAEPWRALLSFVALSMWLWGGMLYIWLMALIFYRYTFFRLSPADLAPPYWINMGAMAISTLAGALLVRDAGDVAFLGSLEPFLKGFTVFYWASGTWWIPLLLVLGVWRHLVRRYPLRYDPLYWSAVFPLGMYAVATGELARVMGLPFLEVLPPIFLAAALAAWTLAMVGMLLALAARLRTGSG